MENKLLENERLVTARFIGCQRVPNKKEYYVLDLLVYNETRRKEYNSAYTLLHLFPKMETCPKDVIPPFTKVQCVFEDVEEGGKPRFIRFYDLDKDLGKDSNKNIEKTSVVAED